MLASVLGSMASYLAGSLLWRIALILGAIFLIVWLAKQLRKGKNGQPPGDKTAGALILLIALAGATAGMGYSALDRAAEKVRYTKQQAKTEAEKVALSNSLNQAIFEVEALKVEATKSRKLAEAASVRAAASDRKILAAQRDRSAALKTLSRRVNDVSKNADGSMPTLSPDWVRDYNAALGVELPTSSTDPGKLGRASDPVEAVDANTSAAKSGAKEPLTARLLASEPVTAADVLTTHIDNAEAARDSAERLTELQKWYNALRDERNKLTGDTK